MSDSVEQQARDLLEQCGVEDAQSFSSGDVVALANFIADANYLRAALEKVRRLVTVRILSPDVVAEIAEVSAKALNAARPTPWTVWLDRYGDDYASDEERAVGYRDYVANLSIMEAVFRPAGE